MKVAREFSQISIQKEMKLPLEVSVHFKIAPLSSAIFLDI